MIIFWFLLNRWRDVIVDARHPRRPVCTTCSFRWRAWWVQTWGRSWKSSTLSMTAGRCDQSGAISDPKHQISSLKLTEVWLNHTKWKICHYLIILMSFKPVWHSFFSRTQRYFEKRLPWNESQWGPVLSCFVCSHCLNIFLHTLIRCC